MKRLLPTVAAIVCGLVALVDFFVPSPQINAAGTILVEGVTILAAFALLLGILNLLNVHARRIAGEASGRGASLVLVVALVATAALGIVLPASSAMRWLFDYLYHPLQATMTALLAFFVVSALYRAFRLRTLEAVILLITSLLVLCTQLPFSGAVSPYLPFVRDWILTIPVTAGVRGLILGTALGTIATALRVLLAVDQPYA